MAGRKSILWCTAIVIVLAYFSYVEYPENCDFPIGIRLFYSVARLATHLNELSVWLGGSYLTFYRAFNHDFSPNFVDVKVSKHVLGGVPTTIFTPTGLSSKDPRPAIIYYHGGGWVLGSVDLYATFLKAIVKKLGLMIVYPEYRLAPENPYPIPLHDCVNATLDFLAHSDKFQVDINKILFVGDSAGGNLAPAVIFHMAKRNKDSWRPCYLNLIYPVLQMSNFMLPSYMQNPNPLLLTRSQMAYFFLHYMGIENETGLVQPMRHNLHMEGVNFRNFADKISDQWVPDKFKKKYVKEKYLPLENERALVETYKTILQRHASDKEFAPLSALDDDIKLLPKTHITTSEYDVLRDDGIILYERMKRLAMDVSFDNLDFAPHGILHLHGAIAYEKVDKAVNEMIDRLKEAAEHC